MRTCPPNLYHTDSKAEQIIFRQLKQVFNDKPSYVAMHSVQLSHHPSKRFGEIDFLLCTSMGLFVLEVKGGQVSCHNGIWHYKDKNGNENTGGSPFYQAHGAMQGLRQSLLKKFDKSFVDDICFGYGVILTDSKISSDFLTTLEYDKEMLCQGGEHLNIQRWLGKFFNYWQRRNKSIMKGIRQLSDEELKKIIQFIRPNFKSQMDLFDDNQDFNLIKNDINEENIKQVNFVNDKLKLIEDFLLDYYEKMIGNEYMMAKDISILVDDINTQNKVMDLLKKLRIRSRVFDEHSFDFRNSYELSIIHYKPKIQLKNKIIIAILKNLVDEEEIGHLATHMVQVFYD